MIQSQDRPSDANKKKLGLADQQLDYFSKGKTKSNFTVQFIDTTWHSTVQFILLIIYNIFKRTKQN